MNSFRNFGILQITTILLVVFFNMLSLQAQISGKIFQDNNANGILDGKEKLSKNILVKAYNNAGYLVGLYFSSATPDANGNNFNFPSSGLNSVASGTSVRLEFANLGTGNFPSGSASGSTMQFVTAPASDIILGLNYPKEYSQQNPTLFTNMYVEGNAPAATGLPTIVSVPYTASGNTYMHTSEAVHTQTGATWGLSWHRSSQNLFAAAYLKRHTSFGSGNSTGVIYKIPNPTDGSTSGVSVFLDLNILYGTQVAGNNPHPNATANFATDESSYGLVGKVAFGGMDISEDEKSIWVVNLADRKLYNIPLGEDPLNPVAPTNSAQITRYPLYNKCDCNGNGSLDGISDNDLRPFAVKAYRGKVYLGLVCNGQSTPNDFTKLKAYVFELNPANGAFNEVLSFPLNYNRGILNSGAPSWFVNPVPGGYTGGNTANWRPWDDVYNRANLSCYDPSFREAGYAQPMLSDIAFDADGNMHIGLRDRFGDMVGDGLNEPGGSSTLLESDGAGDILRAINTGSGYWTMNMTEATNGSEFYANDNYQSGHAETSNGGIAVVPGSGEIVYTVMDPVTNLSFGLDWANTSTGALLKSYETNRRASGDPVSSHYFAKCNGNGDVEILANAAPVEIGNRVWKDMNANGIQDAGEAGISNVTLQLFADFNKDGIPDGTFIGTMNTNAKGEWYFNATNVTDGDPVTTGNQPGIKQGAGYIVRVGASDWNTGGGGSAVGELIGLQLTISNSAAANDDFTDSDAFLTGGASIVPQINIIAGYAGQNNFDYDFGFSGVSSLAVKFKTIHVEKTTNNTAVIKWTVANSEPGIVYHIERSVDGNMFSQIGTVNGSASFQYAFTDQTPVTSAKNYYRIQQVDQSGKIIFSEIRWIKFNSDIKIEVYPVPAVNTLNVSFSNTTNDFYKYTNAVLINMHGQRVKEQRMQTGSNQIDISLIATGTYQLQIIENGLLLETKKIIKQ